jgi:pimeloyl-ACP methyl ester carboxylesterase
LDRYAVVDNIKTHYREEGPGITEGVPETGTPLPLVVLLHGWGANIELFDGIFRQLSSRYHVVGPDLPGFGKSGEPSEALDIDGFADFVCDFLLQLFPQEKEVIFLGHSHGGRITIRLLARPDKAFSCPKAILVDSAGIVPEKTPAQKRRVRTYHFLKEVLVRSGIAGRHPELLDRLQKKFGSADYSAASPLMRESMVKNVNCDLRGDMPKISVPVLLIWGDRDTATPIADGRIMEKLIPGAGLAVIPGAGHFTFLDNPGLFARILGSFLGV